MGEWTDHNAWNCFDLLLCFCVISGEMKACHLPVVLAWSPPIPYWMHSDCRYVNRLYEIFVDAARNL